MDREWEPEFEKVGGMKHGRWEWDSDWNHGADFDPRTANGM
jgi:hypothetical protein